MISTDKSSRRVLRLLFLTHFILSDPPYVCDESMTSAAVWRHPGSTRRLRASASCATVSELHRRLPYGAALNRRDDCIGIMHFVLDPFFSSFDATASRIGIVRDRLRTTSSAAVWRRPGSTRRLRASASCATVSELYRRLPYGAALTRRDGYAHRHRARPSPNYNIGCRMAPPCDRRDDCIGIMHNRPRPSFPFPNDDIGCRMVPPVIDECIGIMHNRPQSVFLLRAITSVAVWNHQRARSKVVRRGPSLLAETV